MKAGLFIGAGCGVVLGAAVWFSMSASDVEAPPQGDITRVTELRRAPPDAPPPRMAAPALQPAAPAVVETAQVAPPPSEPARGNVMPPPPVAPPVGASTPNDEPLIAPSPFQGESKELDYADNLLAKKNRTLEEVRSANDVFHRCVQLEPENVRCSESLARSQQDLASMLRPRAVNTMRVMDRQLATPLPTRGGPLQQPK